MSASEANMSLEIAVGKIRNVGHIETLVQDVHGEPALQEIYTGWIDAEFGPPRGPLRHGETVSFLPITDAGVIKQYPEQLQPSVAVIAGAETASYREDEETLVGVNSATVTLEPQPFPVGNGPPLCLILRCKLGFQNIFLYNMTYHVTLLWRIHDPLPVIDLPPDAAPSNPG